MTDGMRHLPCGQAVNSNNRNHKQQINHLQIMSRCAIMPSFCAPRTCCGEQHVRGYIYG